MPSSRVHTLIIALLAGTGEEREEKESVHERIHL